mgnify:CR=1 FL=1
MVIQPLTLGIGSASYKIQIFMSDQYPLFEIWRGINAWKRFRVRWGTMLDDAKLWSTPNLVMSFQLFYTSRPRRASGQWVCTRWVKVAWKVVQRNSDINHVNHSSCFILHTKTIKGMAMSSMNWRLQKCGFWIKYTFHWEIFPKKHCPHSLLFKISQCACHSSMISHQFCFKKYIHNFCCYEMCTARLTYLKIRHLCTRATGWLIFFRFWGVISTITRRGSSLCKKLAVNYASTEILGIALSHTSDTRLCQLNFKKLI